jgi:hypothetical protein
MKLRGCRFLDPLGVIEAPDVTDDASPGPAKAGHYVTWSG